MNVPTTTNLKDDDAKYLHERLSEASSRVETRAWTGLYNFLTANSILILAWAAIVTGGDKPQGAWIVLLGISVIGIITGMQWALLGTRTWEWDLEYDYRVGDIQHNVALLAPFVDVNQKVRNRWKSRLFKLSSNAWVLFLSPLLIAFLHMAMFSLVVFEQCKEWHWIVVAWVVFLLFVGAIVRQCWDVLTREQH